MKANKYLIIGIALLFGAVSCGESEPGKSSLDIGYDYADEHNWTEALIYFGKATEEEPLNSLAWANQGTAYLNTDRPRMAIESYRKAFALAPEDPYISCSLASSYNALEDPHSAIKHADNALSIDADFAPAMLNKAKALRALGRHKESKILVARAIELKPDLKDHIE